MTFVKRMMITLLLGLASTLTLAAQDRSITFTLAQDTYWGPAYLQAGSYRAAFLSGAVTKAVITSEKRAHWGAIVVPIARGYNNVCKATALTLTSDNGRYAVTSVCFADTETAYYFPVRLPTEREKQVAQTFAGSK